MKQPLFIFFSCLASVIGFAQPSFYDVLAPGPYGVGYSDTVKFDLEIQYSQYGYDGPAPAFVQVWFPLEEKSEGPYLRLGDFRFDAVPEGLTEVYAALTAHMDERITLDCLSYDLTTDEPIDYGNTSLNEVLDAVMTLETRSVRTGMPQRLNRPVIVYHHGSQGMSDENAMMAEYFASRGYVFVSANFHLPYPDTPFGLLPYALEQESKHNQSTARRVVEFGRSLTKNPNLFFIGHSWGAQEGWCFLDEPNMATAFVSLETTIEYKTDTLEIKDKWPYVYDALAVQKREFSIPILLLAAEDPGLNFDLFKGRSRAEMTYASYKLPFAHNSYTSAYLMRYFLGDAFAKPDAEVLHTQVEGYATHLELMEAWLESVQKGVGFDREGFERGFGFR
jgi:pimeloyl-ACP methyl ester carboxylesterase